MNVDTWLAESLERMGSEEELQGVSIHLDELVYGFEMGSSWELGHALFANLLSSISTSVDKVMPLLLFPLIEVDGIEPSAPSVDQVRSSLHEMQPPSLMIYRRDSFSRWDDGELYRVPLDIRAHEPATGEVKCRLEIYRSARERNFGWEYGRTVVFSHYREVDLGAKRVG